VASHHPILSHTLVLKSGRGSGARAQLRGFLRHGGDGGMLDRPRPARRCIESGAAKKIDKRTHENRLTAWKWWDPTTSTSRAVQDKSFRNQCRIGTSKSARSNDYAGSRGYAFDQVIRFGAAVYEELKRHVVRFSIDVCCQVIAISSRIGGSKHRPTDFDEMP